MRITYLKLENLTAVQAGLGKKVVEIDFSIGKNNKILLLGDNGSGKSVILSLSTPYRGTNDSRPVTALPGKIGRKTIHFAYNGSKFEIEHIYSSSTSGKNKSYIKKDGVELNENGNLKSFEAAMEEALDITSDYFAVGRLGTNVKNFIEYSTADRKKYINKFIPNIDDYLIAYKHSHEKLSDINKQLKNLHVLSEKYATMDELKERKIRLEEDVKNRRQEIADLQALEKSNNDRLIELKETKSKTLQDLNDSLIEPITVSPISTQIQKLEVDLQAKEESISKIITSIPKLQGITTPKLVELVTDRKFKVQNHKEALDRLQEEESKLNSAKVKIEDDINTYKTRIDSYNEDHITILNEEIQETNKKKTILAETMDGLKVDLSSPLLDKTTNSLLKDLSTRLYAAYGYLGATRGDFDENLYSKYGLSMEKIREDLFKLENEDETTRKEIDRLRKLHGEVMSKSGLMEILKCSEHHEHTKDCPFVVMATDFANTEYKSIEELEKSYMDLSDYVSGDLKTRIETLRNYANLVHLFNTNLVNLYNDNVDSYKLIDLTLDDILSLLNTSIDTLESKLNKYRVYEEYITYRGEQEKLDLALVTLQEKLEATNKLAVMTQDYRKSLEEKELELDRLKDDFTKLADQKEEISKSLAKDTKAYTIFNSIYSDQVFLDESKPKLETLKANVAKIEELDTSILTLESETRNLSFKVQELNKLVTSLEMEELSTTLRDYYLVEDLNSKMTKINDVHEAVKLVNEALDTKKGIPLIFINNYLTEIAERANTLLSMAYKDNFFIKFEVNEKEFRIIVVKGDGTELDDIALASQGETAMTNISLSLSILANITKGYNILYFDEIDATLDGNNRRNFISVLDKQIQMLDAEQTFIISHNNEFYTADVDLILLNGFETKVDILDPLFMSNKTILYKN